MANLTDYAKKWFVEPNQAFGPEKSGLTPLSPYNPTIQIASPAATKRRKDIEVYQKARFWGFTTRDLQDLDAFTSRQLLAFSINAPINPIFGLDRWEKDLRPWYTRNYLYSLPGSLVGGATDTAVWTAHHPKVWEALEPCLRLASLILENLPKHPWFDALMMAPREDVDTNRFAFVDTSVTDIAILVRRHKKFNLRDPHKVGNGEAKIKIERLLSDVLDRKLTFDFMSADQDPITGRAWASVGTSLQARFFAGQFLDRSVHMAISLSYQTLMPLMSGQLNSAEKLMDQFLVAQVLVHELIHAISVADRSFSGSRFLGIDFVDHPEPYFNDEQENELGRSSEQAFFGGMISAMVKEPSGVPHLGLVAMTFPQQAVHCKMVSSPSLINPRMTSQGFTWPVPVTFYENLCSQMYWDVHVQKFGLVGGLKMPQVITASVSSKVPNYNGLGYYWEWNILKEKDHDLKQKIHAASMQSLSSMTPTQRKEHADLMQREMVANLYALLAERNELVEAITIAGAFTMRMDQTEPNYNFGINSLLINLGEVLDIHCRIISYVPKAEVAAGQKLLDTRNAVLSFHKNLRIYVGSYLPNQNASGHAGMVALLTKIDNIDIDDAFAPLRLPMTKAEDETAQELLIMEAQIALEYGDEEKCKEACSKITQTLDASAHFQALARI